MALSTGSISNRECAAPERIQLDHEQLGPFGFKQRQEARLTHPFDRLCHRRELRSLLELRVHAELGQAQLADVARKLHFEPRPAGDQDHLGRRAPGGISEAS
jgi:hypothetical protein